MRPQSMGLASSRDFLDRLAEFQDISAGACVMGGSIGTCIRCKVEDVEAVQDRLKQYKFVVPYEVWPHELSRWAR